jgi:hypothetical protein
MTYHSVNEADKPRTCGRDGRYLPMSEALEQEGIGSVGTASKTRRASSRLW